MSDLKKHLVDGTIAMPRPEPIIDLAKLAFARHGRERIVTHVSIENAARQLAGEFFELCRSNRFRGFWGLKDRDQDHFIDENWFLFVDAARQAMVELLGKSNTPEHVKEEIHQALCQENAVGQLAGQGSGSLQMEKDSEHFKGDKALNRDVDNLENA